MVGGEHQDLVPFGDGLDKFVQHLGFAGASRSAQRHHPVRRFEQGRERAVLFPGERFAAAMTGAKWTAPFRTVVDQFNDALFGLQTLFGGEGVTVNQEFGAGPSPVSN